MSEAVDTNIILYAYDKRDPRKQQRAIELISSLREGVLLWQVACEFLAASRKLAAQGLTPSDAWRHLQEVRGVLPLVVPSGAVLDRARSLGAGDTIQLWDGLIYAACVDAGVTRVYSEDLPGKVVPALDVVNPF